jgi:dienelactone hydrolase
MKLRHTELSIPAGPVWLGGHLAHAPDTRALIVLLQTSAGNHRDSREAYVAQLLQQAGFATFLLDLLTPHEDARDPDARYNTPLLAARLEAALTWLDHQPPLQGLARGVLASGTGSGAAVRAASRTQDGFQALFCRAGRLDLAGAGPLANVGMPVYVAVGRKDPGRDMVRRAYELIRTEKQWQEIGDVDDLFDQPGALETATRLAASWFDHTLPAARPPGPAGAPGNSPA